MNINVLLHRFICFNENHYVDLNSISYNIPTIIKYYNSKFLCSFIDKLK